MGFRFATPSVESMAPNKMQMPAFPQIHDIHKDLCTSMKREMKAYLIDFSERSCSKQLYAIFEKKSGSMFSKDKFEFVEEATLTKDGYFSLRQFYYMLHAYLFDQVFNYLTVYVEADGDKVSKVAYDVGYDKSMDSADGASHVTSNRANAVKAAIKKEDARPSLAATPAGATAVKI